MPNTGEDRVPIEHLSAVNEASSTGNELHLIELLVKGVHGNLQPNQDITKAIDGSPQTDRKDIFPKIMAEELIEHIKA